MCELCHMPGITLVTPNGERCPDASGCLTRMNQRIERRNVLALASYGATLSPERMRADIARWNAAA
jgi:hypothetical protein